jgi:hypothetical protein
MGIQNIVAGNGLGISVTGMVIVFSGLILISVFIGLLPKILTLGVSLQKDKDETRKQEISALTTRTETDEDELDIVSIIGLVLYMEQERQAGNPSVISHLNIWGTAERTTMMPRRTTTI